MSRLTDFLFGKKQQVPQSQVDVRIPKSERTPKIGDLGFSTSLKNLGESSLRGFGSPLDAQALDVFGLGKDFASKALSPVAAQSKLRFESQTKPGISSAATARGLGRSTIPVRQIAQADVERGAGLDVLLSQLETLNRQAARGAQKFGVGVSQQQQGLEANLQQARSGEESTRIGRELTTEEAFLGRDFKAGQEQAKREADMKAALLSAGTGAIGGGIAGIGGLGAAGGAGSFGGGAGAGFASGTSALTNLGSLPVGTTAAAQGGGLGSLLTGALGGAAQGFTGSNILGRVDSSQIGGLTDAQLLALWRSQGVQ